MFNTFIKQTEVNSGGGIRISVYKQSYGPDGLLLAEQPHQIMVGPFDNFDAVIAANNEHLRAMGFPAIDPRELTLPRQLRDSAHGHPAVQERIAIEADKIAKQKAEEERRAAADKTAAEKRAAERAAEEAAHAAVLAGIAEKEAAREAARAQAMGEAIKAEVAKQMAALAKTNSLRPSRTS